MNLKQWKHSRKRTSVFRCSQSREYKEASVKPSIAAEQHTWSARAHQYQDGNSGRKAVRTRERQPSQVLPTACMSQSPEPAIGQASHPVQEELAEALQRLLPPTDKEYPQFLIVQRANTVGISTQRQLHQVCKPWPQEPPQVQSILLGHPPQSSHMLCVPAVLLDGAVCTLAHNPQRQLSHATQSDMNGDGSRDSSFSTRRRRVVSQQTKGERQDRHWRGSDEPGGRPTGRLAFPLGTGKGTSPSLAAHARYAHPWSPAQVDGEKAGGSGEPEKDTPPFSSPRVFRCLSPILKTRQNTGTRSSPSLLFNNVFGTKGEEGEEASLVGPGDKSDQGWTCLVGWSDRCTCMGGREAA